MSKKVRLASLNIKDVELEDGSKVTVKASINYETFLIFKEIVKGFQADECENVEEKGEQIKNTIEFLKTVIVRWDFEDAEGKIIEFQKELVDDLDIHTITEISQMTFVLYNPEKKSSTQSEPTSSTKSKEVKTNSA
jgi:hypothetical protein